MLASSSTKTPWVVPEDTANQKERIGHRIGLHTHPSVSDAHGHHGEPATWCAWAGMEIENRPESNWSTSSPSQEHPVDGVVDRWHGGWYGGWNSWRYGQCQAQAKNTDFDRRRVAQRGEARRPEVKVLTHPNSFMTSSRKQSTNQHYQGCQDAHHIAGAAVRVWGGPAPKYTQDTVQNNAEVAVRRRSRAARCRLHRSQTPESVRGWSVSS